MAAKETLSYTPKWYDVGDPDIPALAVAYGTIALVSIWLLESITHRLLFCSRTHISISHVAALVVFKGCTWADVASWLTWRFRPWRRPEEEVQQLNRRAIFAIFLRLFVVFAEVVILFMSVPRSIAVFEDQVGSSELIFLKNTSSLTPNHDSSQKDYSPCSLDPIPYSGFTPSAVRQICLSGLTLSIERAGAKDGTKLLRHYPNGTDIYFVANSDALFVHSLRTSLIFILQHVIRLQSLSGQSISLPLRNDTAQQAVASVMSHPKFKQICSRHQTDVQEFFMLLCTPSPSESITSADEIPRYLFRMASANRTKATLHRGFDLEGNKSDIPPLTSFPQVGTLTRPRVAIYPALILLSLLLLVNSMIALVLGDQDILFHMFQLSNEAVGAKQSENPLHAENKTLELK